MRHENRAPVLAEKNRAAPPVSDSDFAKRRMKAVNPALDGLEHTLCLSPGYIDMGEIARIVRVDEPGAEDHASIAPTAAPEVGQVDRVERISAGKPDGFELLF